MGSACDVPSCLKFEILNILKKPRKNKSKPTKAIYGKKENIQHVFFRSLKGPKGPKYENNTHQIIKNIKKQSKQKPLVRPNIFLKNTHKASQKCPSVIKAKQKYRRNAQKGKQKRKSLASLAFSRLHRTIVSWHIASGTSHSSSLARRFHTAVAPCRSLGGAQGFKTTPKQIQCTVGIYENKSLNKFCNSR